MNRILTYIYIIKFQKRGLSYIYIFIILYFKDRFFIAIKINVVININIFN